MKHLGLSGGSTQIPELVRSAHDIIEDFGYRPNIISGVSSGAITAIITAMAIHNPGIWRDAKHLSTNFKMSDFFDKCPVNDKGQFTFTGLTRLFRNLALNADKRGVKSLGVQNVRKVLGKIITEDHFKEYKSDEKYAEVFVLAVEAGKMKVKDFSLKSARNYNEFMLMIGASCAIPFTTQPIKIHNKYYYDGGIRYHNPSPFVLNNVFGITHNISVYSRAETMDEFNQFDWSQNLVKTLAYSTRALSMGVSEGNHYEEVEVCRKLGVKRKSVFLPAGLGHLYDVTPEQLQRLYEEAGQSTVYYMHKQWE